MASQALNHLDIESPQSFMLRDILPGPAWAPYQPQPKPSIRVVARRSNRKVEDGNCLKGFLVAIALEGTAALSVFGIWHLWHLIR
jgi:hypothetical protein